MPPLYLMASELDPLLDDSIVFVRRLRSLGLTKENGRVNFTVKPRLPHGWLNMYFVGDKSSLAASCEVIGWIKDVIEKGASMPGDPGDVEHDHQQMWTPEGDLSSSQESATTMLTA